MDHVLGKLFIVVFNKGNLSAHFRGLGKIEYALEYSLSLVVRRMGLAGKNELHGLPAVIKDLFEPFQILKDEVRSLIGREPCAQSRLSGSSGPAVSRRL